MPSSKAKRRLRAAGVAAALALLPVIGLAAPDKPAADSYTAETTYPKLVKAYPFIRIASREVPPGVRAVRNLTYVRHGERALQLDLYLPAQPAAKGAPAIVFVHGGGWRVGVRDNFAPMAIRMAQRGYAAATISYRLADEAPYPAAVHDARAALRWMRSHAGEYGIDAAHIAIAGGSAGGHIASLAGVTSGTAKFDPDAAPGAVSSAAQAIVNIDGLSDVEDAVARMRVDPAVPQPAAWSDWFGTWYRGSNDELPAQWKEASPVRYAGPGTPPVLFILSSLPRYSVGREAMSARLEAAGIAADTTTLAGAPHSFWLFDPWLDPTVDATVKFLDRQFGRR